MTIFQEAQSGHQKGCRRGSTMCIPRGTLATLNISESALVAPETLAQTSILVDLLYSAEYFFSFQRILARSMNLYLFMFVPTDGIFSLALPLQPKYASNELLRACLCLPRSCSPRVGHIHAELFWRRAETYLKTFAKSSKPWGGITQTFDCFPVIKSNIFI